MITVKLLKKGEIITGFDVSGHSGYSESGSDIICAAVSSAVGLVEMVINDSMKCSADVEIEPEEARVALSVSAECNECRAVLFGFELHMKNLAGEYPMYIKVLEVQVNA